MAPIPSRLLVIAGSGIGNVLLATPLIRSLRRARPEARLDVLAPRGRSEVLTGNADVDDVLEAGRREGPAAGLRFLRGLWRRYDLALSLMAGDRWILNACLAAPARMAHVQLRRSGTPRRWQHWLLDDWVGPAPDTHAVLHGLMLADRAGVKRCRRLVPPACPTHDPGLAAHLPFDPRTQPYAVLHPFPRNPYKCWSAKGWQVLAEHLARGGRRLVVTGATAPGERAYLGPLLAAMRGSEPVDLAGKLNLVQVTRLLTDCSLFVGPDTGITHLAAAVGAPTVALYGPTDPVYWSPWPLNYDRDVPPFRRRGTQRVSNVCLVQREDPCVACNREGCNGNPAQFSPCLQELAPECVTAAADAMLGQSAATRGMGAER